jgi:hypothetical protein
VRSRGLVAPRRVTIQLKDGTWKTITGSNLEMDIEYRDGVPYLVVRERR